MDRDYISEWLRLLRMEEAKAQDRAAQERREDEDRALANMIERARASLRQREVAEGWKPSKVPDTVGECLGGRRW